jgi:hypothetical protein
LKKEKRIFEKLYKKKEKKKEQKNTSYENVICAVRKKLLSVRSLKSQKRFAIFYVPRDPKTLILVTQK